MATPRSTTGIKGATAPRVTAHQAIPARPFPPANMGEEGADGKFTPCYVPAPELREWIFATFIQPDGALHNPDHAHLEDADIEVLWAAAGFVKQGNVVLGQAELVSFRASGWQKGRQEQQMADWFGGVPQFLITLDASYCREADEAGFCSLIEHELYHIAHAKDDLGELAFDKYGNPKLAMRRHDVEEFVGVVRRYGVGHPGGALSQLVQAANANPQVSRIRMAQACGTCLLRAA